MLAITEANVSKLDNIRRRPDRDQVKAGRATKILVVDQHFLIREALRSVLKQLKDDATILEAVAASQAMQIVAEHTDIGFVLLELDLPDRDGFSVLRELRERHPGISVVVFSARRDRDSVARALGLGALGFIPKSEERKVLLSALELVFAGGVYIPPEILMRDESSVSRPNAACGFGNGTRPTETRPADLGLSGRQLDVLRLMMQGKTNKGICRALNLAEPTVKNHVTAILKALKVTNRTEAVIAVSELGWEWPFVRANGSAHGVQFSKNTGQKRRNHVAFLWKISSHNFASSLLQARDFQFDIEESALSIALDDRRQSRYALKLVSSRANDLDAVIFRIVADQLAPVGGQTDIELEAVATMLQRQIERGKCVLGDTVGRARSAVAEK